MIFDFPNYTYSGLLSIVTILFSFAYPKIIDSIADVDKKYHSTLLSARLEKEKSFRFFRVLLVANIIVAILIPFLMYGSDCTHIYIIIQGVFTVGLIVSTFCFFHTILLYVEPVNLHQTIWKEYIKVLNGKKNDKIKEERLFTEWVDLSKSILLSSDQKAARSVHEEWTEYIAEFYNKHKLDDVDYDRYFYDGLTRLNETLCQMPTMPISVNNGNDMMTSLFMLDKRVSNGTYVMLWKNLWIQLFYEKDDWIMDYWKQASQKYELFMREITLYDLNEITGECYTQVDVVRRNVDRWFFLRFHIMLCTMIMKMERFQLLNRMLCYTSSQPPVYPLVLSDIYSIFSSFIHFHKDSENNPFIFESMFPIPGFDGVAENKIQGVAYEYLSLLVLRVYTLELPYGAANVMQPPHLPQQLDELREVKDTIGVLMRWIKKTKLNKKLLEVIGITDWESTLSEAVNKYGNIVVDPEIIISNYLKNIDTNVSRLKRTLPYSDKKVVDLKSSITGLVIKGFKHYGDFLENRNYQSKTSYWVNGSASMIYPTAAFVENPDVSYVGIDEATSEHILHNFRHFFGSTFVRNTARTYNIDSDDILLCIDRLNIDEKQMIVSFDIYWDSFIDRHPDFKKEEEAKYSYKGVKILNLETHSPLMLRQFYVLNYDEIPYLTFIEPDENLKKKYGFQQYNKLYGLWLSLQKVPEHPDLISDEERKQMEEDPNEQSVLAAYLVAQCHWKNGITVVKVQVKHKLIDNGNVDDLNVVKSFSTRDDRNNGENEDEVQSDSQQDNNSVKQ